MYLTKSLSLFLLGPCFVCLCCSCQINVLFFFLYQTLKDNFSFWVFVFASPSFVTRFVSMPDQNAYCVSMYKTRYTKTRQHFFLPKKRQSYFILLFCLTEKVIEKVCLFISRQIFVTVIMLSTLKFLITQDIDR